MMRGERPTSEFRGSSAIDHVGRRPVMALLTAARTGNAPFDVVPKEYQHFPGVAMDFAAEVLVANGISESLIDDCRQAVLEQVKNKL